ncbi:hypothetical protein Sjap_018347 [Stephania japonica]|uniref:Uncharacterized protein n=1 Tax=Stephania japonica TaxID=461633 RepID=A0AAP0NJ98_9MAGN
MTEVVPHYLRTWSSAFQGTWFALLRDEGLRLVVLAVSEHVGASRGSWSSPTAARGVAGPWSWVLRLGMVPRRARGLSLSSLLPMPPPGESPPPLIVDVKRFPGSKGNIPK